MNKAEVELRVSQLMYPSIHYSRNRCLDSMMSTSNFYWSSKGKKSILVPYLLAKKFDRIDLTSRPQQSIIHHMNRPQKKTRDDFYTSKQVGQSVYFSPKNPTWAMGLDCHLNNLNDYIDHLLEQIEKNKENNEKMNKIREILGNEAPYS